MHSPPQAIEDFVLLVIKFNVIYFGAAFKAKTLIG
jgi:hypothetical protein